MDGQKPCISFTPKPPCTDIYSNLSACVHVSWKERKKYPGQEMETQVLHPFLQQMALSLKPEDRNKTKSPGWFVNNRSRNMQGEKSMCKGKIALEVPQTGRKPK